jgi:hypothetical protein
MSFFTIPYQIHFEDTMAYGSHHYLTNFRFQCAAHEAFYQYFLAGLKPRPSGRKERPQQAKRSCFLGRGLGRGCKPLPNLWLHPGRDVSLLV